jgi:hypothetical protein
MMKVLENKAKVMVKPYEHSTFQAVYSDYLQLVTSPKVKLNRQH